MSFVAAAASVGTWAGLTGTAAVIGGGAMIGAGVGGAYSALTGDGNILDSMLTGATIGGLGGWGLNAAGVSAGVAAPTSGLTGTSALASTPAGQAALASNTPAVAAYGNTATLDASTKALTSGSNLVPAGASNSFGLGATGAADTGLSGLYAGTTPSGLTAGSGLTPIKMLGYGLGATTLMGLVGGQQQKGVNVPIERGDIRPYEYSTAGVEPRQGASNYFEPVEYDMYGQTTKPLDTSERNYFTQKFTPLPTYAAANGGQVPPNLDRMPAGGLAAIQGMRDGYGAPQTMDGNIPQFANGGLPEYSFNPETRRYTLLNPPEAELDIPETRGFRGMRGLGSVLSRIANPTQEQASAPQFRFKSAFSRIAKPAQEQASAPQVRFNPESQKYETFAEGGHLGGYSDGGQLLKGPGDGVSDDIPASINNKQPARLADGEFVIPARIVSELGNGSTDAGAKRLYQMMDRIQADRSKTVGKGKVAVDSKARKHLPA